MKLYLFVFSILFAGQAIKWEPDFEAARQKAKESHRLLLLNFSGSDWCGPCILLRRDYLENDTFSAMADHNLLLVNADFPRKKKNQMSNEMVKRNEALAERYNKEGNFPFTLLLNADGKVLKTWKGKPEADVAQWTQEIQTICNANK